MKVTVDDDEETRVELSVDSLGPIDEGAGETYTVKLSSEPTATTTVEITGHGDAPISPDRSALTFTATNWNTAQTVTVTATQDDDAVNDEITLTHTANGGDYVEVTGELTLTVDDDEETDLDLSATSLNPVEGAAGATYTVRLTSEPTGTVTVEIGGHTGTDLTLSTTTLTFTDSNWNIPQTVTVEAGPDADAYDDTTTLTHTASGGDYEDVRREVAVTVDDAETALLIVTPTEIDVVEQNATGTSYTVKLSHVPVVTVTVTISGQSGTDLTLSAATLTFTTLNWNEAQTVTVTASHDADAVNDPATLTHTAEGGAYEGLTEELPVTVDDDEETGVVLSPESLGTVAEGTAASYTVKLSSKPTATTTVEITGHGDAPFSLDRSALTFTAANWDTPQAVRVTADEDDNAVDERVTLVHTANGGDYLNVTKDLTLTVDDEEETDLDLSATSLNPVEGSAGGTTYTVKLTSEPTGTVTVEIGGHPDTDLTLSTTTLNFTPTNWDTAQTVRVTAGQDLDAYNDTATLTHTANGGDYGGVTASLPVTVDDDETASLVLSKSSLEPVENATGTSYTVRLSHVPTETVTVSVSGQAGTDLTLSTTTLTFAGSNWNNPQTVTVTASHDDDAVNDPATLTHTAKGGAYQGVTEKVAVTVVDDEETRVELSVESLGPIEEGSGETYTVKLSSKPTATTTVEITGHGDAPVSLDRSALTFTATNWNTPQTVTVTATQDDDAVNDPVTLTHTANGGDYLNVTKDLTLTVDDDEETDLDLSATSLNPVEGGASTTYTVKLTSEPSAAVTVEIGGHSGTDLTLSGVSASSTLIFTPTNWNIEQTVAVTAGDDPDAADDTATLTHTASGVDYGGVTRELAVTVDDDETASLIVSETSLEPGEGDASGATYTVKLSHVPTEAVTVSVSGHDGSDLTLSTTTLTFTGSNWNNPQTVTVTASHDDDAVNDPATLTHTAKGGAYQGVTEKVAVTVDDDEETRVELSVESLGPVEEGATQSYMVKLSSEPTATTTVEIGGHEDASIALDKSALTFTAANWDTTQTVTVTANGDDNAVDERVTLVHTANGGDYVDVTRELTVTVTDDEETNVLVSRAELSVEEGNATGTTYTVRLTSEPTGTVTVGIGGHSGTDLRLSTTTLTFTASNWNTPQTVTVEAGSDADAYDDTDTLTHTANGGDYKDVTKELPVRVDDDETASIVLSESSLEPVENATGTTYTVELSHVPTATVTVEIGGHTGTDLTLSTTTLTFTSSNWNEARTVTVTASHDDDAVNDPATLTHTAKGGAYEGLTKELAVTVVDAEDTNIVLSRSSLDPTEEDTTGQTYTVRLSSQPTATTTVRITGHEDADITLDRSALTFTATNWNTAQTVRVTATQDPDAVNDPVTLTHTANGGDYVNVTKELPVTVYDDEETNVLVSRTELSLAEGNATGTSYTVRLSSQPTATVTVAITGHDGTDLTLSTTTLTFTDSDWNTAQTVRVTVAGDEDAYNDTATLTHMANGGDYGGVMKEVKVTVDDDETASLLLSRTSLEPVENAAGTTYTVKLSHVLTEEVTVTISGHSGTDLTLSTTTLTFTATSWNSPRTVTVTASHDPDAVNDPAKLTHTGRGGAYQDLTETVAVTVDDDEETDLDLSATSLAPVEGGASTTYTVRLTSEPTAPVTVEIEGHSGTDLRLSGVSASSTLTFIGSNWDTEQTVTVTAGDDPDAADDTATLKHTANGGDYRDVTRDLPVTVEDDESPHLVVVPTEIDVVEANATGTSYTVRLGSQPTATATVEIAGHEDTDLRLSTTTLTFTTSNWNTPLTVTVTAEDDPDAADDRATLTHTASGGDYGDVARDLPVTAADDDTASIVLSKASLAPVEGSSESYTVKLSHVPTATATVGIAGHTGTDLTLDRTVLTFTTSNWNTAQTVTVTAAQDPDADDDPATLTHTAEGADEYGGVTKDLPVTVDDDEEHGVNVAPSAIAVVAGGSNSYTARLDSQPAGDVTVTVSGHAGSDLTLSGTTLTFTTSNWDTAQTVTVSAGGSASAAGRDALAHRGQRGRLPLRRPVRRLPRSDRDRQGLRRSRHPAGRHDPQPGAHRRGGRLRELRHSALPRAERRRHRHGQRPHRQHGRDRRARVADLLHVHLERCDERDGDRRRGRRRHGRPAGHCEAHGRRWRVRRRDRPRRGGHYKGERRAGRGAERELGHRGGGRYDGRELHREAGDQALGDDHGRGERTGRHRPGAVGPERQQHADLHDLRLEHRSDRDGHRERGRRRGGRRRDPDPHGQRRGLPGRHEGAGRHGDRRRDRVDRALQELTRAGRERHRHHLHGEALQRADRDHHGRDHGPRGRPHIPGQDGADLHRHELGQPPDRDGDGDPRRRRRRRRGATLTHTANGGDYRERHRRS